MVRVPSPALRCVAFVGSRRPDDSVALRGTMFFISRRIGNSNHHATFAVTARHVLDGIRRTGQQGCFRLTLALQHKATGTKIDDPIWMDFEIGNWVDHPDRSVDAAVMCMPTTHMFAMDRIPPPMVLTKQAIDQEGIGVGDEVFTTGLFVHRTGVRRSIPIVRVGNIAAMREEAIQLPVFGEMDAYLIEARSIGGLSGSPSFVYLGGGARHHARWYWMGLVHGHYDSGLSDADEYSADVSEAAKQERVNMGIAIVVPADRILEVFDEPSLKKSEQDFAEAVASGNVEWLKDGEL